MQNDYKWLAGSGKSFFINTMISCVRTMFQSTKALRGTTTFRLGTLLAFSMFAALPALAHDKQESFEMTVILDAAYGGKVMSGKFDEAISRIKAPP